MPWGLLALALLLVPILEIYVIIQVGQVIGAAPTIVLIIAESALGAWIVKREGRRAWQALTGAFQTGRLPGRELADAALVLVGGTLLLTPGFVTDVAGFFFVLPPTRPVARRALSAMVSRRMFGGGGARGGAGERTGMSGVWRHDATGGRRSPAGGHDQGHGRRDGRIVPGEVVDDE